MKTRYLIWVVCFIMLCVVPASEVFSQYDPGIRDTVRFGDWSVYVTGPPYQGKAILPVVVVNDEPVGEIDIPLTWTGPLSCDSGKFVGERPQYFNISGFTHNNDERWMVAWARAGGDGPLIPPGEGDFLLIYFSVLDTGLVSVDTISMFGFLHLCFSDTFALTIIPQFTPTGFHLLPSLPGDVNGDRAVDLGDVVFLISYLFRNGTPPAFLEQGDINTDCVVNLGDVVFMITYLYKAGAPPQFGCGG